MNNFNNRVYIQPKHFHSALESQHIIRSSNNTRFQTPKQNKLDMQPIQNSHNYSDNRMCLSQNSLQRSIFKSSNRSSNDINGSPLSNNIVHQFHDQKIHKSLNLASVQISKYNQTMKGILKKSIRKKSNKKIRFDQNVKIVQVENWKTINRENTFVTNEESNNYCCGYQSDDYFENSCHVF